MRVYQYGLHPPTVGAGLVAEQLRLAWEYRRDLTIAARARRDVERELLGDGTAAEAERVAAAERELVAARKACTAAKVESRSRKVPPELKSAADTVKAALKARRAELREARARIRDEQQIVRDGIAERWASMRRSLRGHYSARGLRHGTYIAVEDAQQRACADMPLWDGDRPQDPRYPLWDGSGSIGVQLQGGRSLAQVTGDDSFVQIAMAARRPGDRDDQTEGRPRYGTLRLRVGSADDRSPIWAEWPIKMHRLLPDVRVKRVMVSYRHDGPCDRWTVELTVDEPDTAVHGSGVVAVDVGWRRVGDELRVAAWRSDDQPDKEPAHMVTLQPEIIGALRKPQELRSLRDEKLNDMRGQLCTWLRQHTSLPGWLRQLTVRRRAGLPTAAEAVATIAQWRSPKKFVRLVRAWKREDWGADGYELLETWRYRDHHLWEWECSQRGKALRRRRERYRVFAAVLARTYETIVIERFDKRQVAVTPPAEETTTEQSELAQSWRVIASTSELVLALKTAARRHGARVVAVDPAWSTQHCPNGHEQTWDAAASIKRRPPCPVCGCEMDQDDGACRVLLRRYRERSSGDKTPATAHKPQNPKNSRREGESRQQHSRRLREERLARLATARKQGCNAAI